MIELVPVYREKAACKFLYDAMKERTPDQSISHKKMPTMDEHAAFFYSKPYTAWYLLKVDDEYVGSIYLTDNREIGIFILNKHQGKGYGSQAVSEIMSKWPGPIYANINPRNEASIAFFEKLGAKHIQNTFLLNNE